MGLPRERNVDRHPVRSSNLKSIGYDLKRSVLEIEFVDGGVYQYSGVPESVHQALMAAASHGSFSHHRIKDKYAYRKVK